MWNWLPPADFQLQAHSSVHHMGIDLDAQAFFDSNCPLLNSQQQIVYHITKEAIDNNHGGFFFLCS